MLWTYWRVKTTCMLLPNLPHLEGRRGRDCMVVEFPVYFVSDVRKFTSTCYLIYQWHISDVILKL